MTTRLTRAFCIHSEQRTSSHIVGSSRTRFMIETLTNLKNNKLKKNVTQNQGGEAVERMKKFLSGLSKKRHSTSSGMSSHVPLTLGQFYRTNHCASRLKICILRKARESGGWSVPRGEATHYWIGDKKPSRMKSRTLMRPITMPWLHWPRNKA